MKTSENVSFSEKIKKRNRLLWGVFALMLCYMVVISELGGGDSRKMTDLADTLSRIIFFGGMLWVLVRIAKNKNLLKKENYEKLRSFLIKPQNQFRIPLKYKIRKFLVSCRGLAGRILRKLGLRN